MSAKNTREQATLLDILIDGFEKNEILHGFHWRMLPMSTAEAAQEKFDSFLAEVERWKGPSRRLERSTDRRIAAWPDLELRQLSRGLMVRVRAPGLDGWWRDAGTWEGDPIGPIFAWIREEAEAER